MILARLVLLTLHRRSVGLANGSIEMQKTYRNPLTRPDTLLGVCQAIGEDFGFNPIYLRVALALGLLWNPTAMFVAYFALGAAVLISRLIAPNPKSSKTVGAEASSVTGARAPEKADHEAADEDLAVAA
jgi:phage shock protein C